MKQQKAVHKTARYLYYMKNTPLLCDISKTAFERAVAEKMDSDLKLEDDIIAACMFVLEPVLFSFICWVLQQTGRKGQQRIYFLARDGYFMLKMAESLCRLQKLPVECRYLYASRYAWRIPEQEINLKRSLERICAGGINVSFAHLMRRAGLSEKEGMGIAKELGMEKQYNRKLTRKELYEYQNILAGCKTFMQLLVMHSGACSSATEQYLKQEGLLENISFAIVDSGWIGTMQESLQALLKRAGRTKKVEGYYFGLYNLPSGSDRSVYHSYYFAPKSGAWKKAHFSNSLFECVFTAPHGMTIKYENENGKIKPVQGNVNEKNLKKTEALEKIFQVWISVLEEKWNPNIMEEIRRLNLYGLLSTFMSRPSLEEAGWFGSFLFSDDVTEDDWQPLAAYLTGRQMLDQHFLMRLWLWFRASGRKPAESGWVEGSICLYGGIFRRLHRMGAILYKYTMYIRMQQRYTIRRKVA